MYSVGRLAEELSSDARDVIGMWVVEPVEKETVE